MAEIAVLGGGSWGTALADHLARRGHRVHLLFRDADLAAQVHRTRVNDPYLPGTCLPVGVLVTADPREALAQMDLALVTTPVRGLQQAARWLEQAPARPVPVVSCAKGIQEKTLETPSMALARLLPDAAQHLAILSGPSFAVELVRGDPTAAVVASRAPGVARQAQEILSGGTFRLYTNEDPAGVELAGALKNVMALAAGVVTGLGLGANTMAALITRGLAEMSRLGLRMGGRPSTFAGLAGLGDLVLTCTSPLSRNHSVGRELGRGRSLQEILNGMRMVAEGVSTTRAALQLARREGVEMPIVEQMHGILFAGQAPRRALDELLARELRRESDPAGAQGSDVAGV